MWRQPEDLHLLLLLFPRLVSGVDHPGVNGAPRIASVRGKHHTRLVRLAPAAGLTPPETSGPGRKPAGTWAETAWSQPDVVAKMPRARWGEEEVEEDESEEEEASPEMLPRTSLAAVLVLIPSDMFPHGMIALSLCVRQGCHLLRWLRKSFRERAGGLPRTLHAASSSVCVHCGETVTNVWPPLFRKRIRPRGEQEGTSFYFFPPPHLLCLLPSMEKPQKWSAVGLYYSCAQQHSVRAWTS